MIDCGHVFCTQCLQDFYNNAITEGDVTSVRCLEPNCADKREKASPAATPSKRRKPKTFINPSELLQIPLDHDMVKRYVTLKHKSELESDKNTVYCPRPWCQGAARSKKHRKPQGLEFVEGSEDESDEEQADASKNDKTKTRADKDLLAICEDCGFAFCSRCGLSWHGEFEYCLPKERKDAITEEEKASIEYIKMHTTPCPTCDSPCQKTHGCNHMRCFRCQTHFCYLCSAWLNPGNPYQHFNVQPSGQVNGCFMRLWELEGGDGNDVGMAYQGPALRDDGFEPGQYGQHLEILQPQVEVDSDSESEEADAEEGAAAVVPQQPPQGAVQAPQQAVGRFAVAREGPLVLRIEGDLPPARGRAQEAHGQAQPVPPVRGGLRAAANNGQRRGRGRGGLRGRGVAAPGVNRQNDRMHGQNQRPLRRGRENEQIVEDHDPLRHALNQADEDWVRQFVQFALNDQEHLLDEWDSGDEDD
jgi:E3 ubiquitin-protein ligase RNF14